MNSIVKTEELLVAILVDDVRNVLENKNDFVCCCLAKFCISVGDKLVPDKYVSYFRFPPYFPSAVVVYVIIIY